MNSFKPSPGGAEQCMEKTRKVLARKRIALVAHDKKKKDLVDWVERNRTELSRHELLQRAQQEG